MLYVTSPKKLLNRSCKFLYGNPCASKDRKRRVRAREARDKVSLKREIERMVGWRTEDGE